jgi:oligosaccharide repeat unit polymerase
MDQVKFPPYSQTNLILLVCQIVIIIFLCILGILENQSIFDSATVIYPLCILFTLIIFWCFFSWTILTKSFFSPYILFLIAAALFNGGHIFLEILGINPVGILSNKFSSDTTLHTIFLVTISIASLHLGALISNINVKSQTSTLDANKSTLEKSFSNKLLLSQDIRKVGWILLVISLPPTLFILRNAIGTVSTSGYVSLYESLASEGSAVTVLSKFIIPSGLFLLAGSQQNRFSARISILLILTYSITYNFLGQRTNGLLPLLSLAWLWHNLIKPLPKKVFVPLTLFMAFVVSPLIAEIRGGTGLERFSLTSIIEKFTSFENPITSTLFEFGGSMQTIAYTIELVPSQKDFNMGVDYLYALYTLVPNIGFGGLHPTFARGVPATWLSAEVTPRELIRGISLGYSFIAEAYLNFGWIGTPIFMAIFGFYIGKLVLWATRLREPTKMALLASFLPSLLFFCRQESTHIVRPFVLYSLAPYLGILFLHRLRLKRLSFSALSNGKTTNAQSSIYPYAMAYENRQNENRRNDLMDIARVNSINQEQQTTSTQEYKLDELLAVLNKLSSVTIQHLGNAVVTGYWRSSRPESSWLAEFEITRNGHISHPNQKEIVCSPEQTQQIQSWILAYIECCKRIVPNLEQILEKDCHDSHQKKLLSLTKILCNFM